MHFMIVHHLRNARRLASPLGALLDRGGVPPQGRRIQPRFVYKYTSRQRRQAVGAPGPRRCPGSAAVVVLARGLARPSGAASHTRVTSRATMRAAVWWPSLRTSSAGEAPRRERPPHRLTLSRDAMRLRRSHVRQVHHQAASDAPSNGGGRRFSPGRRQSSGQRSPTRPGPRTSAAGRCRTGGA